MSDLKRIENFLTRLIIDSGYDPTNPEEKATIKMQSLMEAMKEMAKNIGDEKMLELFKNNLSSLVLEATNDSFKDFYLNILNEFNRETNSRLN